MQKIKKISMFVLVFLTFIVPVLSSAYSITDPLVPCGTKANLVPCDFNTLMTLVNNVIHFILYYMVVPIAAIMFAYAGFLLISAGGEAAHARTKAKEIFSNAIIGLIIAIAAFLTIRTILSILGYNGSWLGFNPL
jgi:hypothetical protein